MSYLEELENYIECNLNEGLVIGKVQQAVINRGFIADMVQRGLEAEDIVEELVERFEGIIHENNELVGQIFAPGQIIGETKTYPFPMPMSFNA
jgi:hypothetical protein